MKTWSTKMQVLDQNNKELFWVDGMKVIAPTRESAQNLLDKYDYNYLVLEDELIAEIPCKPGTLEPDWCKMVDYEAIKYN